ncbi:MAG: lipopolysaccharide biosynthesis protein [Dysgonamonadaceae bacterium]|jgi:O-antigen/teichoic acid export membrane protein|nr:lipopolysaccharide biosynthesis protein [Dysgonamonadaceae bacterium]
MLYFRQILIMLVSLYTVRVVLKTLGAEDYGIYNVVAGVVVLFSFLNGAMTGATQRFLNYALGQNNTEEARDVYSLSFMLYVFISLLVIILAETIGLWFLQTRLNIPTGRKDAAFAVYQFSIAATVTGLLRVPYHAVIIAYERMSFFALASVIESLLKLGTVFLLAAVRFDSLVIYAFLVFASGIIIFFIYKFYCNRTFETARFRYCGDRTLLRRLVGFSGWSIFGGIAYIGRAQGTNILINIFTDVTVNAAMAIATQVNSAVYSFVANFQTAFNPQIIKSYAAGDLVYFKRLLSQTSKISFYLLFILFLPVYINAEFILKLWLKDTPEYTVIFMRLILILSLTDAVSGPLWMSIQATGDIKKYQIIVSCFIFVNLPLSLLFLMRGFSPEWVLIIRICLEIAKLIWLIFYLREKINLPIRALLTNVFAPIAIISVISGGVTIYMYYLFSGIPRFLITCSVSVILNCLLIYFAGLHADERYFIKQKIRRLLQIRE